ncbi:hypothetical protein CKM354_000418900 [Cercospora kikuchii]|uniref:Tat pathway signal sequence n=1 Tax=Cercospora kikuchii TaxID=84275 RepID=A0A9P3CGC9_9PEZI|nr:uncharacterized protein CKM354_000418900 [Cercospora kikuchii]GIZ40867.1 hypothetical protein CKM354_000418900 [Cercospora kikuchii]
MAPSDEQYAPLRLEDEFEDEKDVGSSEDGGERSAEGCRWCKGELRQTRTSNFSKLHIALAVLITIAVFFLGYATNILVTSRQGQKAQTYSTEFKPARPAAELEQVRFTGSAQFDDEGEPFFDYAEDQVLYTGTPTKAMDRAWNKLIKHRYFLIDDSEAREAWGPDYEQYYRYPDTEKRKGGYVAGLDVLHTLHCVNMLRKALYKDYYKEHNHGSKKFQQYHIDHCLDIVRQNIQCNSDLTLIPTRWWDGMGKNGRNFIDSDQVHTCRNFGKIREWAYNKWNHSHRVGNKHLPPVDLHRHIENSQHVEEGDD